MDFVILLAGLAAVLLPAGHRLYRWLNEPYDTLMRGETP